MHLPPLLAHPAESVLSPRFRTYSYPSSQDFARAFPRPSASTAIPFRIRTYVEHARKPFRIRTYAKTGGGGDYC